MTYRHLYSIVVQKPGTGPSVLFVWAFRSVSLSLARATAIHRFVAANGTQTVTVGERWSWRINAFGWAWSSYVERSLTGGEMNDESPRGEACRLFEEAFGLR